MREAGGYAAAALLLVTACGPAQPAPPEPGSRAAQARPVRLGERAPTVDDALAAEEALLIEQSAVLAPVELSALIAALLPPPNDAAVGWDLGADLPAVRWITDGIEPRGDGGASRTGMARVRAGGRTSTVLRRRKEELPWKIELATDMPHDLGVRSVAIEPGVSRPCFGALYAGCVFTPQEAFGPPVTATPLCREGDTGNYRAGYRLSVPGRRPTLATFTRSEGSGGATSWIELRFDAAEAGLCRTGD